MLGRHHVWTVWWGIIKKRNNIDSISHIANAHMYTCMHSCRGMCIGFVVMLWSLALWWIPHKGISTNANPHVVRRLLAVSLVFDTVWKWKQRKVSESLSCNSAVGVCVCLRACILLEVREAAKWFSLWGRKVNVKVWRMGLGRTSSWISMLHLSPSVVLTFTSKITSILLSPPTGRESRAAATFCLSHQHQQSTAALRSHPLQVQITQQAHTLLDLNHNVRVICRCGGFECFS